MAHEDFTLSMNNNHPYPFMLDPPFQYDPSEGHDIHVSAIENPMAMETPNFYAPRNLNHYQSSENIATRMESLDSAMARLDLSDNRLRNTANVELYSNSLDSVTNNLIMDASTYEKNLHEMRIRASVEGAERRLHSSCLSPTSTRDMDKTEYINHRRHGFNYLLDFELRREQVVSIAKDYNGSLGLQLTLDFGTFKEIESIISNVMNHLHDLMIHPYGNFLIQKIFLASRVTMVQKNIILFLIIMDEHKLIDVCMDDHGTRVVQKILENINTQQISEVIGVMKSITVVLMKNFNGGYVIQQCVKLFPPAYKKVILDEVAKNCVDIATDRWGCSIIQKCLRYAEGEAIFFLVQAIILNAAILAEDPYGNYVVQFLVKMENSEENKLIIARLRGKYVGLSMNKHGSNVVEDLLKISEPDDAATIVLELMNSPLFFNILQDPYGNYVVQRALEYTKGSLHRRLSNKILSNQRNLRNHIYGKWLFVKRRSRRVQV